MSVSPELAFAAAAAIKDHALEQQTNELVNLRKTLRASQEVEITGLMGRPVYCRGSFQDGNFRENMGMDPPGVAWEVELSNDEAFEDGAPLRNLCDMEIRIGGIVFATTRAAVGTQCRVRGAASNQSRNDVLCPIFSGDEGFRYNRIAWMAINFTNLPDGPWRHLQSCATHNNRVASEGRDDIFHRISHPTQLPRRLPGQRASVTSIRFYGASVLGLIRNVLRDGDADFERKKEEKITEIETIVADFAERI
mmetsp:Transcript_36080/g.61517  ORF Transcript_36080/g.61517 Transcript_36080/m.61517 type:complete len:251 (-) Transcript_36080:768-1520(-)|eukprot:CAMPEP_0183732908 /NCGR_PEP_ID=MMETSP0737-20130205/39683_1 /TAXON_ID=385413 /ORGANISM="Thalassiosira miniscula, Strain CCMP1093" /LENGTH=250 /DNA_ID=CAMNT_0025966049 /DNA_START=57 /DNA_END=809 /DNA_ORIENTATION=+